MNHSAALAALQKRVKRIRSRTAVRAWEYRQRNHAKGVWFRLRRVLAESASVWIIPADEARRLTEEGLEPEPVGRELEPPKMMIFVSEERLALIAERSAIPVRLGPELFAARCLALIRFDHPPRSSRSDRKATDRLSRDGP